MKRQVQRRGSIPEFGYVAEADNPLELTCIDLRPWAKANRYRFRLEESYQAERPQYRGERRWYVEVLCRYGLIYPYGGETLLAYASRGVKRHIAALPGVIHHQYDGDSEVFKFPAEKLDAVASILQPRRRRTVTLTPEQIQARREQLRVIHERRKSRPQSGQEFL